MTSFTPRPFDDVVGRSDITYSNLFGSSPRKLDAPGLMGLTSAVCKQADFATDAFRFWCQKLDLEPFLHRKAWEFLAICQALYEADMLREGRKGLCFGVGTEKLPALFASMGAEILATDQAAEDSTFSGWSMTNQHASSLEALSYPEICPPEVLMEKVRFMPVDMNFVPESLDSTFDFCWSACAYEHLGSIEHGLAFIEASMKTLKPGGIAVHTTEYNLSSNDETVETTPLCVYRRKDMEAITERLERAGHTVLPWDFSTGDSIVDAYVDLPPYAYEPHTRLLIERFSCTSNVIIVRKGGEPA